MNDPELRKLWGKYEDIAMHFNDLLMRLRSQSVAGIAAVSTLVGIFTREGIANIHMDWLIATLIFVAMTFFWIAIFCVDFFYYNRLLLGAVSALKDLEAQTSAPMRIDMSTKIEAEFHKPILNMRLHHFFGVIAFYLIVWAVIIGGAIFTCYMYLHSRQ